MATETPSADTPIGHETGPAGRLPDGRFAPGNRLSVGNRGNPRGNPAHRRMRALQAWIVE